MAENWICRPIIVVTWWPLNACYAESSESNYFSSGHELPIFASSSPLEIATYSSVCQAFFCHKILKALILTSKGLHFPQNLSVSLAIFYSIYVLVCVIFVICKWSLAKNEPCHPVRNIEFLCVKATGIIFMSWCSRALLLPSCCGQWFYSLISPYYICVCIYLAPLIR